MLMIFREEIFHQADINNVLQSSNLCGTQSVTRFIKSAKTLVNDVFFTSGLSIKENPIKTIDLNKLGREKNFRDQKNSDEACD